MNESSQGRCTMTLTNLHSDWMPVALSGHGTYFSGGFRNLERG